MTGKKPVQEVAALWMHYSYLSVGRSGGSDLLDNGGYATAPAQRTEAPGNSAVVHRQGQGGVLPGNEGNIS